MISLSAFGRTGHDSSRVIFGAAALGSMSQARADETLALLPTFGVNHIDTAASYGESELRLRPFLAERRADYFVATKTGQRDGDGARRELELSLQRLGLDAVDLIQLHNLVEPDEFEIAHAPGGAIEALSRARDEGLVRFIGITGHGTRIAAMHLRSLARFDFDSVLLPYNFTMMQNASYREDFTRLVEVCGERGVAVQTIKSVARRRWPADFEGRRIGWYQPLPEGAALRRAVRFVLSQPTLFLNSPSDARLLPAVLDEACSEPIAPTPAELEGDAADLDITPLFDGDQLERI